VSTHQANHARILSLRNASQTLDEQILNTLTLLTSTRTELLATPATVFPTGTNPVSYSELLSYARLISKFTIPPSYRESNSSTPAPGQVSQSTAQPESQGADVAKTNGTTTPIDVQNGLNNGGVPEQPSNSQTPAEGEIGTAAGTSTTALPAPMTEWLNPLAGVPSFVPWPTEETIKRGALASIQVLLDQGVDPATFDPERAAELEAERQRLETEKEAERERLELEKEREQEREMVKRIERERERAERRESVGMPGSGAGVGAESKPTVFMGLDLLDDMDEDDD
jgi:hypothetical protein